MKVYFNGQYLELDEVKISPFDRGFLYADGVYEVMRTYYGKQFRPADHLERLKSSLSAIRIKYTKVDEIENIIYKLIELNGYSGKEISAYIQITRGISFPRKHSFPQASVSPTVFVSVSTISGEKINSDKGVKIILEKDIRWARCDIKSISLLPNVLANQHAIDEGAEEAVWVRDGFLIEGSHTNFWGINNDEVWTAPLSNFILPGVSRKVIFEICKASGFNLREQAVKESEIKNFNEFFISGTTTEIKPVIQIDDRKFGDGKPGKITKQIQLLFDDYVKSKKWM